jgi:hypothetical protein
VAWGSFVWVAGLGCLGYASSWWFFSAKCGSSIPTRFLIYGAHAIFFLTLVAILILHQLFLKLGYIH